MEKPTGLASIITKMPYKTIEGSLFLEAPDLETAGLQDKSQCLDIKWEDEIRSIVFNKCNNMTDVLYITFPHGQKLDISGYYPQRFFARYTWKPVDAHVLCFSDPIHFYEWANKISLGFCAVDLFGPQYIPAIIKKICSLLHINHVVYNGSSAGGWTILKCLSMNIVPSASAIVCWGVINTMMLMSICNWISLNTNLTCIWDINFDKLCGNNILFIQNIKDKRFYESQYKPYLPKMLEIGAKVFTISTPEEIILEDHHHYGFGQTMLEGIIKILFGKELLAPEISEIERHLLTQIRDAT